MTEAWEDTTAGTLARLVGQAGQHTPEESRWRDDRQAARREYFEGRGWIDDDGSIRPRTTQPDGQGGMVTVDLMELASEHQRGGTWIGEPELRAIVLTPEELSDAKLGKLLGKLRAQQHARASAASAEVYREGEPTSATAEAARRIAASNG